VESFVFLFSSFFKIGYQHSQALSPWRGGRVAFVAQAGFLGLLFGWVANDTGVILWTAMSHILIDFSALGWDVLFTKDQHETVQISQHH
jgi:membrane protease YdiL (CAAX protease family)